MTDDFIRGLETELVDAMERYERHGPRRRHVTALSPRRLRPATLTGIAATALILVAVVLLARNLAPEPRPARPRVVAVLAIGGTPMDAVVAGGSLWATDYSGSVLRIDPVSRRVIARLKVPGSPVPITSDAGSVWVQTAGMDCKGDLLRIDPSNGQILARTPREYPNEQPGALTAVGGGVWVKRGCDFQQGIDHLDRHGAGTGSVALESIDGMAAAAGSLWVIGHDGTVTELDTATGRIRQRWPHLAPLADPITRATNVLSADSAGVWILSPGRSLILRIEHHRVVRRIPLGSTPLPLLASTPDGLWITTADHLGGHNRLIRIDPRLGKPTATVNLAAHRPAALIPTGDELAVLTANGTVLFIRS